MSSLLEKQMQLFDHANRNLVCEWEEGPPTPQYLMDLSPFAVCKECGTATQSLRLENKFAPAKCAYFTCWNILCKTTCWYYCMDCKQVLSRNSATYHFTQSKKHKANGEIGNEDTSELNAEEDDLSLRVKEEVQEQIPEQNMDMMDVEENANGTDEVPQEVEVTQGLECMSLVDLTNDKLPPHKPIEIVYPLRIEDPGNAWLSQLYRDRDKATVTAVSRSFDGCADALKYYWVAEHSSPEGCWGGGLCYLAARSFHFTEYIECDRLPSVEEAIWHFRNFIQFISMSAKQRSRQAIIQGPLAGASFFKTTEMLVGPKAMNRHYGFSGKSSFWNNLPIPTVHDLHGVAYVNPVEVLTFAIANGMPMNEFYVSADENYLRSETVYFVGECNAARDMWERVKAVADLDEGPVLLLTASVWRDGFGSSRSKQNRKSVVPMTMNIGARNDMVNTTDTTFLIALGLKTQKKGWRESEHRFRRDMQVFRDPSTPVEFYSGILKKTVRVYLEELVYMEDKQERADMTYTLSCNGHYHRRFGYSWRLENYELETSEIKKFLKRRKNGSGDDDIRWGWSDEFVDTNQEANGCRLPACWHCRKRRLVKLGLDDVVDDDDSDDEIVPNLECAVCADWNMTRETTAMLAYALPQDYPTTALPDCPVMPPLGREVGEDIVIQEGCELSFDMMIQAARFAFYHCSRRQQKDNWNKNQCTAYLKTCCFKESLSKKLYSEAKKTRKDDNEADYNSMEGIAGFAFPGPWVGLGSLKSHIETVMHLVFLGNCKSNLKHTDIYLDSSGLGGKNTFRKNIQPLLKDLKKFQLDWCLIMPFSASDDSLKTGSWVSENWLSWCRISKVAYAWFHRDTVKSQRLGADDVSRVIIAFHAMVARLLTHGGVDGNYLDELDLYIKEFLSAVHELDIQARHTAMPKDDPWWFKSNYISLLNLVAQIERLGPAVNWWDGSGKGEKFIQLIKPLLPTGVRETVVNFMVRLAQRVYKRKCMEYIEQMYLSQRDVDPVSNCVQTDDMDRVRSSPDDSIDHGSHKATLLHGVAPLQSKGIADDGSDDSDSSSDGSWEDSSIASTDTDSDDGSSDGGGSDSDDDTHGEEEGDDEDPGKKTKQPATYCLWEDQLMSKARTIHIYKNEAAFDSDANNLRPISGIVVLVENELGVLQHELYAVIRMPHSSFGWCRISFEDDEGVMFKGLWYAEAVMSPLTDDDCPQTIVGIQSIAKMAAIAIPLHYAIGDNHEHSLKYCVITNWWKERQEDGTYALPKLDFSLYQ